MLEPQTVTAFLALVHEQVARVGPREHIAVERFLRAHGDDTSDYNDIRAGLTSILAQDEQHWQRIAGLFDTCFAGEEERRSGEVLARRRIRLRVLEPKLGHAGRIKGKLLDLRSRTLANRRRLSMVWLAVLALVAIIAATVTSLHPPSTDEQVAFSEPLPQEVPVQSDSEPWRPQPVQSEPEPPSVAHDSQPAFRLEQVELTNQSQAPVAPPEVGWSAILALTLLSAAMSLLGWRLVRLGPVAARAREKQLIARRQRTETRRQQLEEAQARSGEALTLRYHVECFLPVSRRAIIDSASLLGRIFRREQGGALEAISTIERTIQAGGHFQPVHGPQFSRQEVLVLIDLEDGDHPWLGSFKRLLEAWETQGIGLRRYMFYRAPQTLAEFETGHPLSFEDLARSTDGLPLILFSRQIDPCAMRGYAPWTSLLNVWPRRAWLDPDPRRLDQLPRERRYAVQHFLDIGLPRFHLSAEGVVLLARWLSGDGVGLVASPTEPRIPPLPARAHRTALAEAFRKWALAASLVPDPTWDQLEAIRRYFSDINRFLSEPRHLQCLLDYVESRTGRSAESGGGRLEIPETFQDAWLREQLQLEADNPDQKHFRLRAHELILRQLGDKPPEDELERLWWKFKRSVHQAALSPKQALQLLSWIPESAIAHEGSSWLDGELNRQEELLDGQAISKTDLKELRELITVHKVTASPKVPFSSLWIGYSALWARSALVSLFLSLGMLVFMVVGQRFISDFFTKSEDSTLPNSPTYRLVDLEDDKTASHGSRPEMITLLGGEFLMGSTESLFDDERPVHRVKVDTFQISKTEVTVAQYRACVEAKGCSEPEMACNWQHPSRSNHPINCVSWKEARAYATWFGGRLPSEAEWEYAARSGGLDRIYPWGEENADCKNSIVRSREKGAGCGEAKTSPVCSRPTGNTIQGLCDMAGSVWEWVEDDWHFNYVGAPSTAWPAWVDRPKRSPYRVYRGGSWWNSPEFARVANRLRDNPSRRLDFLGFRVAMSFSSKP